MGTRKKTKYFNMHNTWNKITLLLQAPLLSQLQEISEERHGLDRFHLHSSILRQILRRLRVVRFPAGPPINPDLPIIPILQESLRNAGDCTHVESFSE